MAAVQHLASRMMPSAQCNAVSQLHVAATFKGNNGTATHETPCCMSLKGYEQLLTNRKSQWYPQPEGLAVDMQQLLPPAATSTHCPCSSTWLTAHAMTKSHEQSYEAYKASI